MASSSSSDQSSHTTRPVDIATTGSASTQNSNNNCGVNNSFGFGFDGSSDCYSNYSSSQREEVYSQEMNGGAGGLVSRKFYREAHKRWVAFHLLNWIYCRHFLARG